MLNVLCTSMDGLSCEEQRSADVDEELHLSRR